MVVRGISNERSNCLIHNNSEVRVAKERYSASADEQATVVCFLDFQPMRAEPRKITKPVEERLEVVQLPQSASQKAVTRKEEFAGNKSP